MVASPPAAKPDPAAIYVQWWHWALANRLRIAYTEDMGVRLTDESYRLAGTLPLHTDCSGLCYTLASWTPGFALPYDHAGNTDSLMTQCHPLNLDEVRPGDLIIYGPDGHTAHVVAVLQVLGNGDFLCGSHGSVSNPCHAIRHSDEAAWQRDNGHPGVHFRRIPVA